MKYVFTYSLLWLFVHAQAQLHDNMWILENPNSLFHIDFRENSPHISQKAKYLDLFRSHSVLCDKEGNLLYYTDCRQINNNMDSLVENGDGLNSGYNWNMGNNPIQNGSFFLPAPGDSTRCYFLYMYPAADTIGVSGITEIKLQYALIDMTANNGLGKVLEKNIPLLTGGPDINFNHAGAVRHANGRDWWILVPNRKESRYYRILLTPEGFSTPIEQEIGFSNVPNQWTGYNLFSPDGTRYAVLNYIRHPDPWPEPVTQTLQFYDFDRCTGLLSNPILVDVPPSDYSDIAFSPSGKRFYLTYGTSSSNLAQFDLDAGNIQDSWQLIFSCPGGSNFGCGISKALLAPNGKIYVSAEFDTVAYHVIHQPDSLGAACDLELGGLVFPAKYPNQEFSYFPNYRLGPIDGSPCDTLGIDNIPVASFFWDSTELAVNFTNASYHEPDSFYWDFGDGDTSTEVEPQHDFPAPGFYNVCLTASNANGSDTVCKLVGVDTLTILPVAAFTWDAQELEVTFTNHSSGQPESYLWDFGDTQTSTETNPAHVFDLPGSYNVCLTASNTDGNNTYCEIVVVDTIAAPIIPVASFTWGAVELEVTFTNLSYNSPEDYMWDFGDGDTSTEADPVHNFALQGNYNVCLTASNANGNDTYCTTVKIDTTAAPVIPVAAFTWDSVELEVTFTNISYNMPVDFLWDFGDTETSVEVNPIHNYSAPGDYNVCLTASNANGSDMLCQIVTVDTLLDSTSLVVPIKFPIRFSIYPNPTTGKVQLESTGPFSIDAVWSIHDLLGREVYATKILTGQIRTEVELADILVPGLYFWRLNNQGYKLDSGKLVIKK